MSTLEKRAKVRVQNKYDTEANWLKAVNFIPLKGETIYYAPDETHGYVRTKIGDGVNLVKDLPFEGNIVPGLTEGSLIVGGEGSTAGAKGFYIAHINAIDKEIYLYTTKVKPSEIEYNGNWLTATHDINFEVANGYSIGDKFTIYIGKSYPYCGTITNIENNIIKYEGDIPSTFKIERNEDGTPWRNWDADHIFYVPTKPEVGYTLKYTENDVII